MTKYINTLSHSCEWVDFQGHHMLTIGEHQDCCYGKEMFRDGIEL